MMGKRFVLLLLTLALVLTLGACGAKKDDAGVTPMENPGSEGTSAPEESQPEESQPEESSSEESGAEGESSQAEPEIQLPPGIELPQSIRMGQFLIGSDRVYPYWEMEITDKKELARLAVLLSVEGLSPLSDSLAMDPDGGTPLMFDLLYEDREETLSGYLQPDYRIQEAGGCGSLTAKDTKYACPGETCDAILDFLAEKYVQVVGAERRSFGGRQELPPGETLFPGRELPPGTELPQSISITQVLLGMDRVYPYWELEITDEEEIARLTALLSVEGLNPLTKDQPGVPEGGTPIEFELKYADRTEGLWGYLQPGYRIKEENGRGTLGNREAKYACPAEICDAVMAFLEEKYVRVVD